MRLTTTLGFTFEDNNNKLCFIDMLQNGKEGLLMYLNTTEN